MCEKACRQCRTSRCKRRKPLGLEGELHRRTFSLRLPLILPSSQLDLNSTFDNVFGPCTRQEIETKEDCLGWAAGEGLRAANSSARHHGSEARKDRVALAAQLE